MKPEITNFIDATLEEKIDLVYYKDSYVGDVDFEIQALIQLLKSILSISKNDNGFNLN